MLQGTLRLQVITLPQVITHHASHHAESRAPCRGPGPGRRRHRRRRRRRRTRCLPAQRSRERCAAWAIRGDDGGVAWASAMPEFRPLEPLAVEQVSESPACAPRRPHPHAPGGHARGRDGPQAAVRSPRPAASAEPQEAASVTTAASRPGENGARGSLRPLHPLHGSPHPRGACCRIRLAGGTALLNKRLAIVPQSVIVSCGTASPPEALALTPASFRLPGGPLQALPQPPPPSGFLDRPRASSAAPWILGSGTRIRESDSGLPGTRIQDGLRRGEPVHPSGGTDPPHPPAAQPIPSGSAACLMTNLYDLEKLSLVEHDW